MPSWSMDHNGTDIESSESSYSDSDSENEQDEMYIQLDHPGTYQAYFSVRASNKSTENANMAIGVYINNKKDKYKEYSIAPNSILTIEDFIPVTSHENDLIQIKFNAPNSVDLETYGLDFLPPTIKTKL